MILREFDLWHIIFPRLTINENILCSLILLSCESVCVSLFSVFFPLSSHIYARWRQLKHKLLMYTCQPCTIYIDTMPKFIFSTCVSIACMHIVGVIFTLTQFTYYMPDSIHSKAYRSKNNEYWVIDFKIRQHFRKYLT